MMISRFYIYYLFIANFLKTLQVVLELPLNLQIIAPAHQTNWDLVSDLVSSGYSKHYRNALECKKRFENFILKREEMCLSEIQNKKHQQQLQLQQKQQQEQQQTGSGRKQTPKPVVDYIKFDRQN
jgi:septum formation inhibitor MinC